MIRKTESSDLLIIKELYQKVAAIPGGLARNSDEISSEYIETSISNALSNGLSLLMTDGNSCLGEIHASRPQPEVFSHVLSDLTICVDPDCQGAGFGKQLFWAFIDYVNVHLSSVMRLELFVRESNQGAITLYEKLGFVQEGRFKNRILNHHGEYEDDIAMAYFFERSQ